ncbi:MAG TPA: hypothetical protein VJ165_02965 [candidate division Zixibacteria bacterium]|nr:hypothetical protein [candidate division Zixibacteria bacterium]
MRSHLILAVLLILSCSSGNQPKNTVMIFFGAMRSSDTLGIVNTVDLEKILAERKNELLSAGKTAQADSLNREKLIEELTVGNLNQLWLKNQIVVGKTEKKGDTALVEISFIDPNSGTQYYNKMALYRKDKDWKIFAFKVLK